ncbi:hypothetical protein AOX55_00004892 (plasmid) [Sinorhizobium fredii CCBAU 25509]|nr:hypothetical protein AOX55_00004892 [Sinorhizobium fredii CCBAU 25509]
MACEGKFVGHRQAGNPGADNNDINLLIACEWNGVWRDGDRRPQGNSSFISYVHGGLPPRADTRQIEEEPKSSRTVPVGSSRSARRPNSEERTPYDRKLQARAASPLKSRGGATLVVQDAIFSPGWCRWET